MAFDDYEEEDEVEIFRKAIDESSTSEEEPEPEKEQWLGEHDDDKF